MCGREDRLCIFARRAEFGDAMIMIMINFVMTFLTECNQLSRFTNTPNITRSNINTQLQHFTTIMHSTKLIVLLFKINTITSQP